MEQPVSSIEWIAPPGEQGHWRATRDFNDPVKRRAWQVEIELIHRQGRIEPTAIRLSELDGRPITAESVRDIPWGSLIRDIRIDAAALYQRSSEKIRENYLANGQDALAKAPNDWSKMALKFADGTRSVDSGMLEDVAALYRRAALDGNKPTAEIALALSVSRSTAARWVRRARDRGLLGDAVPGKAGEVTPAEEHAT